MLYTLSALIGIFGSLATHFYLTIQHYHLKLGFASGPSICNINSLFNCDSVAASSYSSLYGVPVALLALVTHSVLAIILLSSLLGLGQDSARLKRYGFWLSLFVFTMSLVMGSISTFMLGTYCLFCMLTYLFSMLILWAFWKMQEVKPLALLGADIAELFKTDRWVGISIIAIPALGFLLNSMFLSNYNAKDLDMYVQESVLNWKASPEQSFNYDVGLAHHRNGQEAKMTIVEFADYLCPHCKMAAPSLQSFSLAHPEVKLIFKPFPLDGNCNEDINSKGNNLRCQLAYLTFCSEKVNKKGWDVHYWIFDNQDRLHSSMADFKTLVNEASQEFKLDAESVLKCTESDEVRELVTKQAKEGALAKIQGTPTVFVNGKKLERGNMIPVLEGALKSLGN